MPCDVTFHPVEPAALEHFFFDVWREPALAAARAAELCSDGPKRSFVERAIYGSFEGWRQRLAAGERCFGQTVALGCAAIAGYLEGYTYGGSSALGMAVPHLSELEGCFTPLPRALRGAAALPDESGGLLAGNFCGSGLLLADALARVPAALESLRRRQATASCPAALFGLFEDDARRAVEAALGRATRPGWALLEAADLVEPRARRGSTDLDNLRLTPPALERGERPSATAQRERFPCLRSNDRRHDP